jgi:hypothetical protein
LENDLDWFGRGLNRPLRSRALRSQRLTDYFF